ncbi:MAG: PRC-barrel domain-containing protein [Deltaproteobacteria bacterium]|nr:PRC-barrel domain-containing protein [Deltaproteobacteria bacterium]
MLIRDNELKKRRVHTSDGRAIGVVESLEIDTESLRITAVIARLESEVAKQLGAKKSMLGLGHAELRVAIDRVSGIGDAVVLRASFADLQGPDEQD